MAEFRVTLAVDGTPVEGGFAEVSHLGGILRLNRGLLRPDALPDRRVTLTVFVHDMTGKEVLRQTHRNLRLRALEAVEHDGWLAIETATLTP